jgi:hypothetical protein
MASSSDNVRDAELAIDAASTHDTKNNNNSNSKANSTHVDDVNELGPAEEEVVVANSARPNAQKEAPMSVARMSDEERAAAEKALVRKIDLRLLPMLVIMYILNYLDRG